MLESLFNKVQRRSAATLLKRDSNAGVFEYFCSQIALE